MIDWLIDWSINWLIDWQVTFLRFFFFQNGQNTNFHCNIWFLHGKWLQWINLHWKNKGVIWHLYKCHIWVFRWACKRVNLTCLRCQWHFHWCQKDTFRVLNQNQLYWSWFNTLKVSFWHQWKCHWHLKRVKLTPLHAHLKTQMQHLYKCQMTPIFFQCTIGSVVLIWILRKYIWKSFSKGLPELLYSPNDYF